MPEPCFCKLTSILNDDCVSYITNLQKPQKYLNCDLKWVLAFCDDGVVWGKYDKQWLFSSDYFPELSQKITEANLQQLRIFGEKSEILIWRTESGFTGRILEDNGVSTNNNPLRPDIEKRIILGNQIKEEPHSGFTILEDSSGRQHAVPLELAKEDLNKFILRLDVKHYFEKDENTGAVRVSASRLVSVYKEEKK